MKDQATQTDYEINTPGVRSLPDSPISPELRNNMFAVFQGANTPPPPPVTPTLKAIRRSPALVDLPGIARKAEGDYSSAHMRRDAYDESLSDQPPQKIQRSQRQMNLLGYGK